MDEKPIDEFLREAIEGLAHYYLDRFERISRIDNRLAFLKHEKWNVLEVIARCFVEKKWQHVIALTHQISQPLDILGYWDERIELADKAIQAADRARPALGSGLVSGARHWLGALFDGPLGIADKI